MPVLRELRSAGLPKRFYFFIWLKCYNQRTSDIEERQYNGLQKQTQAFNIMLAVEHDGSRALLLSVACSVLRRNEKARGSAAASVCFIGSAREHKVPPIHILLSIEF